MLFLFFNDLSSMHYFHGKFPRVGTRKCAFCRLMKGLDDKTKKGDNSVHINVRHTKLIVFKSKLNITQDVRIFCGFQVLPKKCDNEKLISFSLSQIGKVLTQQFFSGVARNQHNFYKYFICSYNHSSMVLTTVYSSSCLKVLLAARTGLNNKRRIGSIKNPYLNVVVSGKI